MIGRSFDAQQHLGVSVRTVRGIAQAQPQLIIDEAVDGDLGGCARAQHQRHRLRARSQGIGGRAQHQYQAGDAPQAPQHPQGDPHDRFALHADILVIALLPRRPR